ncbi:ribonuclease D [Limnothrix redekei]|uniref:Ribonuclease H-like domain-containing protein n=1 Tax=Limnothrix redekei LRLZ20PSL1 TaxID=3112953 RepID=A0ABW7C5Y3_9CYAN
MLENFQVFEQDLSAEALADYRQASALAIDTETMGLKPWRDRLCLVQICNSVGQVAVVRIARGQTAAPNLKQLLENEAIEKVFHFARFDVAMLQYHLDIATNPIFCTKIASKLARTYSPKHGLKDLINELEGVELDKRQQSSDWGNAVNLSVAQLEYASNDVRYLLSARQKLMAMLQREERWELAQQCFVALQTIVQLDLLQYENIFEH